MEIKIISTQNTINSLDSTRDFAVFLLKTKAVINLVHWYVLNYDIHKILGKLYEDLDELFDALQEEIIGVTRSEGVLFPKFDCQIPVLNIDDTSRFSDDNNEIINLYFELYKEVFILLTSIEFNNFASQVKSGINNTKDEILSKFNKATYLISLVK